MKAPHKCIHLRATLLELEYAACRVNACRSIVSPHRQSKIAEWTLAEAIDEVTCARCLTMVAAWRARAEGLPTEAEKRGMADHLALEGVEASSSDDDDDEAAEEEATKPAPLRETRPIKRPALHLVPGGRT